MRSFNSISKCLYDILTVFVTTWVDRCVVFMRALWSHRTWGSTRRTPSPRALWRRRVFSLGVAVVALIALVVSGCPDSGGTTNGGTTTNGGDSTAPTFTTAPALDGSPTATAATVKLTASEAGKVFWVLYASTDASPDNAADLIADASGDSAGEQRSGANDAVTTAEETVTITGLIAATTYNFYAVLQDAAGNNGDVSTKLVVTTASTASYICTNGTAKTGNPAGNTDVVACETCAAGFTPTGTLGEDNTDCTDQTAPTFSTAPAVDGDETATTATVKLTASEAGKVFWVLYADSTADAPSPDDLITAASGSTIGVKQSGANEAVTTDAKTVTIAGLTPGTTYNFYAVLQDSAGNNGTVSAKVVVTTAAAADVTPPAFASGKAPAVDGDETASTATVKFTATEAGKVFWVLYAISDASPDTAAALIIAASGDSAGEQRSGANDAVTTAEETVTITGLIAATTYNFYAVLQDAAGNNGDVSTKLVVTTASTASYICTNGTAKTGNPAGSTDVVACESCETGYDLTGAAGADGTECTDQTVPTFSVAPALDGNPAATAANVKLTASEAGKVFWVLYADNTPAPTDVAAFIAAAADGNTGVKQSGDAVAVDAATELTVALTGLQEGTTYNFYAVLQDSAGNNGAAISAVVEITTADVTAPTFSAQPAVKDGTLAADAFTVTLTSDETAKLFWAVYTNGTAVADADALLMAVTADPQPGTVVARSVAAGVDVTTAPKEVAVSGLTAGTDYDFYAALQDDAGNTLLSNKLDIATAIGYTCTNGASKAGTHSGASNIVACQSCDSGFKLTDNAGADNTECVDTVYTCANGTEEDGKPNTNADAAACKACNSGYSLVNQECRESFTLDSNNSTTVLCPHAALDATGDVPIGVTPVTFTKRAVGSITLANAATTCTSGITDMSNLFKDQTTFNANISHWDTSSVTTMQAMFSGASSFNQIISEWDVSMVTNMSDMFNGAQAFNAGGANLDNWDVSMVTDMSDMFNGAGHFTVDISGWDVSMVTDMSRMFNLASDFGHDLSGWCVSQISTAPPGFAEDSILGNNDGHQPKWGMCPSS